MTPAEQIAYLRNIHTYMSTPQKIATLAVCDLAERALLTAEETKR